MDEGHKTWKLILERTGYFSDRQMDESRTFDRSLYPGAYKSYQQAVKRIPLDKIDFFSYDAPIGRILNERRSLRNFIDQPLSFKELSFLLWASQGITANMEGYQLRTAPSAGALYPVETYLVVKNVESLSSGLYHYEAQESLLELLKEGDFVDKLYRASLGQEMIRYSAVTFCYSSIIQRSSCKYYERAVRYIMMDSAHICENTLLGCVALERVGGVAIGAFYDDLMAKLFDLDMYIEPIVLMAAVGKISGTGWKEDRRTYIERIRAKAG
ncbi:MAG: hypothetical protein A2161_12225 [Candidatus Schekmanbacteria bacterium RBG_13_48_7]|uniref:Nitroreductase domain-containing protein n=1 Tax=Candidatus Schekmanbacteria bacterium RBG_13_48_7 TaxID=1817878 RepID=A0A1F7RKS1_9BACT|nr:MAG: hypothetical protein A2161_12225 [Candidatus Schekmanbacteria bacterium RBG_13_48_7]